MIISLIVNIRGAGRMASPTRTIEIPWRSTMASVERFSVDQRPEPPAQLPNERHGVSPP